ncbi:competence protein CoiA family protein [Pseudomonas viciae]|uniref:hypothetical protein n=1 Tax=Pseudomonas viciae TaxID=2505979 RepID=UPI0022343EB6|nr:hypothetical protein [Pseudomonas viciae]UZE84007.1 hypothetical protein LOY66_15325 [Pseudomonas viciae]
MDYAVNTITNQIETAEQATRKGRYVCPLCRAKVLHRAGLKQKKCFAHWPGFGSAQCQNFVPGLQGQHGTSLALSARPMRSMELRLKIEKGKNRAAWYLELTLPPCRSCEATVTLDVGNGILQEIDMRGMAAGRRLTAELSTNQFRILSFRGDPDPHFVVDVERACQGLPSVGAAVFTASGGDGAAGFPRAHELRKEGTYALLWKAPDMLAFPDELVPDKFRSRQGWNLALVTVPASPSCACAEWLESLTGLTISRATPSISIAWPFLARNSSLNSAECIASATVIVTARGMPVGQTDTGPTMLMLGGPYRLSATGVERNPALFALVPDSLEHFRVAKAGTPEIEKFFSTTFQIDASVDLPGVEFAFTNPDGVRLIVPFMRTRCKDYIELARLNQMTLEYLAIPPGTPGWLYVERASVGIKYELAASDLRAPHNLHQRLLAAELQESLIDGLTDAASHIDLHFGGFGRLRLKGCELHSSDVVAPMLLPAMRLRLRSFMSQLQGPAPILVDADDDQLVCTFSSIQPQPALIPHYRALMRDVVACGFEVKPTGKSVSP